MREFLKDIFANVIANLLVLGITNLASMLLAFGAGIWIVISQTNGIKISFAGWLILGFAFFIASCNFIVALICLRRKKNKPEFPQIVSDVRYQSAITELFFEDRENISCSREVNFKVLCKELTKITKRFTWTGSAYKKTYIEKADGEYTLHDMNRQQPPQSYDVVFDSKKQKGETGYYKTRTDLEDKYHVMSPYLSHQIRSQTDYLELRVTTPIGMVKNVRFVEYADNMGELPLSKPIPTSTRIIGNLEVFEQKIEEPRLLHVYRLEWKFNC